MELASTADAVARAKVHATLALAAATALCGEFNYDYDAWVTAAGSPREGESCP
jgi:hypothetical protein